MTPSIRPCSRDNYGWRRDLHECEKEPSGDIVDGLFGIGEALNDGGDKGSVEVELEMVAGEHGGGVQSLECTLGDSEVVILEERCVGRRERGKVNKISI